MHLVIIIAFASLLWFNSTSPVNLLELSTQATLVIVAVSVFLPVLLSTFTIHRSLRKLSQHPDRLHDAQHAYHQGSFVIHIVILACFLCILVLTRWPGWVQETLGTGLRYGLDDLIVMLPFLISLLTVWIIQYPLDRSIRRIALQSAEASTQRHHPVWSLSQYLVFNVRYQLLTIAVPMGLIIIGDDLIDHYRSFLRQKTGLLWIGDAGMGVIVCIVFLLAPVLLRFIWNTKPLPAGSLRTNLQQMASRMRLRFRELLVWHTEGMVVNAAVMGVLARVRYVLISDGLLESLKQEHVEAVFGHEAGHVRHWHITYFIIFATLTMLIAGGLVMLLQNWLDFRYTQLVVGGMVIMLWGFAFGWLSHQFEYHADLAGAEAITPTESNCHLDCSIHSNPPSTGGDRFGLCATAAAEYGKALLWVAKLNGLPEDEKGWRHPSINRRVAFLKELSYDSAKLKKFNARIRNTKWFLLIGTFIGLAVGAYLYWDYLLPRAWRQ